MTLDDIKTANDAIAAALAGRDYERAHAQEDRMRLAFIRHVADRQDIPGDLRDMAREALQTSGVAFPRWCG